MRRPLVWFAAAFSLGIELSRWTVLGVVAWLALAGPSCVVGLVHLRAGRSAIVVVLVGVGAAGAWWSSVDLAHRRRDPLREFLGRTVSIEGVVVRPPQVVMQETGSRTRVAVAVEVVSAPQRTRVNSTVLITLPGEMNPVYGDRIRVRGRLYRPLPAGNPGEVSYRDSLRASGIDAVMAVRRAAEVHTLSRGGGNPVLAAAYGLRARITVFFRAGLPGPAGALLASLLLGDDGAVSPGLRDAFRTAGLLHVLVVSGVQVVLVLGCMLWVGRLVRAPPRLATAAAAAGVAFFAVVTGWVPSVGRATVMAMVGLAAVWLRRDRDVYTALAAAGIVLLIADPSLLFDLGFQLSFAATWGLLYVAPAMSPRLRGPQWLRGLVAMTVGAQLAVLPVLAYHVGRISAAGFLANLAVVPLVGVLVPAGFATAGVGLVVPPLGVAMLGVLRPILMV